MLKRTFDVMVSAFGLVVLAPFFAVIAWMIRHEDAGPVFYRGVRVGLAGKPFRIYKFRSMVIDAEKLGGSSTAVNDPRILKIGRVLRQYKLDEFPQLLNVLQGEMSLVGPRPEVQQYVDMYTQEERAILGVKPGITDWASLWNSDEGALLAGSPDPEKAYLEHIRPHKIKLQLEYVRQQSFLTDLTILLQTLVAVIFRVKPRALSAVNEKV